ncbi:hypothetical protein BDA99DRAFT_589244 [Phascolomyces articulosus]|uniref:Uncharacterized protein n=1 Tax=Phascolomyces articulosus TaxID=60185 RepID=A0AAD5K2C7_9FUNG|nr:hypothetical protein BDA99DRAFT_589244 [Phascolomyces articulosus]
MSLSQNNNNIPTQEIHQKCGKGNIENMVKDSDVKFQVAVKENKGAEEQENILDELINVQSKANKYHEICRQQFPTRVEFMTRQEIDALKESQYEDAFMLQRIRSGKQNPSSKAIGNKMVEQCDTPEQKLKSMTSVLHMMQRRDEKIKNYAKRFYQCCIESGLDKYPEVMIVSLLSSLEKKNKVYNLVWTKFGSDVLKQSLNDIVNYLACLHVDG